jgi:hypothetical protein
LIKVNLNRSRVDGDTQRGDGSVGGGTATATALAGDGLNSRDMVVKLVVMFVGVAALTLYERQNLDDLSARLASVNANLNKVKADVSQKQVELAQLKDIEPKAQELNDKLKVLREFSKQRLAQLQNLDFVQSVIPDKVWLRAVKFDGKRYQINGNAIETSDLSEFVSKLETSSYFQDVIIISDRTVTFGKESRVRDFEISARVGTGQ